MGDQASVMLHKEAIETAWLAAAYDTLLFLLDIRGQGFPIPEVKAVFHLPRRYGDAARLHEQDAVADWLRSADVCPFFSKPVESSVSVGTASINRHDADALVSADGRTVPVAQFAAEVARYDERGYIFQERIATHPALKPVAGKGVSACRMCVRMIDGKPQLHRATWKIPVTANLADNFWRDGNIMAAFDPETGVVTRAVRGMAVDTEVLENHPDTGAPLVGMQMPDRERMRKVCLDATQTFPALWVHRHERQGTDHLRGRG